MPLKLHPKDRKLFLVAGAIFLVLVVGALIFAEGQGNKADIPTTYSVGEGGAKAAFLLLHESGYQSVRWEQPLDELPDPAGRVLIIADPTEAPTSEEISHLRQFIADGGHVIATGMFAETYLPRSSTQPDIIEGMTWKHLSALSPSSITRAAPEIVLAPEAYWNSTASALPLYGEGGRTRVVKYAWGKGEVIWWASATPLTNQGLQEHGNLEFFLACLGEAKGEVLWDEYVHGYRQTLSGSAAHSPVMWVVLQLGLVSLAVLATFSRRSGPIFPAVAETRLSPLEFVYTLGGLYQQAGSASVAVDVCYQRLRYWLTRRLGMANNASIDDLQAAVRDRLKYSNERFAITLRECEAARYNPDLASEQALRLVQELDTYAVELKLFGSTRKEKVE
jgi:hypothetical protein